MKSDTEEPSNNRPTLVNVGRRKLVSFARRLTRRDHECKTVAAWNLRGYQRQGSIEISAPCALYAVDFWWTEGKIRSELLPPAAADCAVGVRSMEARSTNEDDKLSTEPGQLHCLSSGVDFVVASAWPLDDVSAVTFVEQFYSSFASGAFAAEAFLTALHETKKSHLKTFEWGAFDFFGNPTSRGTYSESKVGVIDGRLGA